MDHDMTGVDAPPPYQYDEHAHDFIIAVDFGTTFSSVCYTHYNSAKQRSRLDLSHIEVINRYPDHLSNVAPEEVPSEILYTSDATRSAAITAQQPEHQFPLEDSASEEDDNDDDHNSPEPSGDRPLLFPSQQVSPVTDSNPTYWGYSVAEFVRDQDVDAGDLRRLTRFKLMLSDRKEAAPVRARVRETCQLLKKSNLIADDTDVIADYLDQLFCNTKEYLKEKERYQDHSMVEFVLCVPAVWTSQACRAMEIAMTKAIKSSRLGNLRHGIVDNLFLVSEPEAAAASVIAENKTRVKPGDIVVLIDAGGGTVDVITYELTQGDPLRMRSEILEPGGSLCGSSYINERYEELLVRKLKNATFASGVVQTRARLIDDLVIEFERGIKHKMDRRIAKGSENGFVINVPGLLGVDTTGKSRFSPSKLTLKDKEVVALFTPSVIGTSQLMLEQIEQARALGKQVEKVLLIGGFGQSQTLKRHLTEILEKENRANNTQIELVQAKPGASASAVAQGGILRALRKEQGPERRLQSSYGFLRTEPYKEFAEHAGEKPRRDKVDKMLYVENTIDWVIHKGDVLKSEDRIIRQVEHTFRPRERQFICKESLCVSDLRHESHYRWDHPKNHGSMKIGEVAVDMSFVRGIDREGSFIKTSGRSSYWRIKFDLILIISGRNLRYEVRWPDENGELRDAGHVSLAPAFRPGTE